MKFKLKPKVGSHSEVDDKGKLITYRPEDGHIFETELDLVTMFPNKFERVTVVPEEDEAPASKPKAKSSVDKATEKGAEGVADPANPLGRDVTKRFALARKEDFLVFADGGAFHVVEADEPTKALNDKPLHKKQVTPFIKQYLNE